MLSNAEQNINDLALKLSAEAASTVSVRISSLKHEALDYTVEAYSVIEVVID